MSKSSTTAECGPFTRHARPIHPGLILREDFMPDYGLTVLALAVVLNVSRHTVSELLHERRALSPDMAFRLGRLFGNSTELWLDLQQKVDLWDAEHNAPEDALAITRLEVPEIIVSPDVAGHM